MKLFKFILVTVTSFLFFYSQSAFAVYGSDDVANDDSEKTTSYGTEMEINEFVLLDAMPDIELYYYPYSADDADAANTEDVPGGAGSVFVGGGVIKWHANIDSTIAIEDFILIHIDTATTERNEIAPASVYIDIFQSSHVFGKSSVDAISFVANPGIAVSEMSSDMNSAYTITGDNAQTPFDTDVGYTDHAAKFYFRVQIGSEGSVQAPGTYRATATVRALPTVS